VGPVSDIPGCVIIQTDTILSSCSTEVAEGHWRAAVIRVELVSCGVGGTVASRIQVKLPRVLRREGRMSRSSAGTCIDLHLSSLLLSYSFDIPSFIFPQLHLLVDIYQRAQYLIERSVCRASKSTVAGTTAFPKFARADERLCIAIRLPFSVSEAPGLDVISGCQLKLGLGAEYGSS
jgi:hypothetical protein